MKRIFKRALFYTILTLIVIVSAGILSLSLYGEEIKRHIIRNFNESINTPINVESIDINGFTYFPYVTVQLKDVDVTESIKFSEKSLLNVEFIEFKINPINLLVGDYSINTIVIRNGNLNMRVNRRNEVNYQIIKTTDETGDGNATNFDVNKVIFSNVNFTWEHVPRQQLFSISTEELEAQLQQKDTTLLLGLEGKVLVDYLKFDKSSYLEEKEFQTAAELIYYNNNGQVNIQDGLLVINESDFKVNGFFNPSDKGNLDFSLKGKNTNIQTIVSFLPKSAAERIKQYRSDGDVYFDLRLHGRINGTESPAVEANFGVTSASITYPKSNQKLKDTTLEGTYKSGSLTDLKAATLKLSNVRTTLDSRVITGNLEIANFNDPRVDFSVNGSFNVSSLLSFFPQKNVVNPQGDIDLNVNFQGRISDLNSLSTFGRINSDGQVSLTDVSFESSELTQPFRSLNGSLLFNKNSLALQSLGGYFGKSHFELDGFIRNIFSFLLTDNQPLKLDATLKSEFVDIDELLSARVGESTGDYSLVFSSLLDLRFDCEVSKIKFKRFSGNDLSGVFKIKDQLAMLQRIRFDEIGGEIKLEGLVDTKGPVIDVLTKFSTKNIYIDSLFYVFEDFGQDFLVHDHLKGTASSSVNAELQFTKSLDFIPQSLTADMQLKIHGGELIGFEPMKDLSAYIPDDSLHYLKFSDLENEIHVENRTIYLPRMEVQSNVTAITIGGTYTFDHHINYKVVAPIIHTRRLDKDEVFGAIEDDGSGVPKIHLLLTGTTEDYTVSLDKTAIKSQLVTELRTEVNELKQAFRKKQQAKQKELVLDDDDEFDW